MIKKDFYRWKQSSHFFETEKGKFQHMSQK